MYEKCKKQVILDTTRLHFCFLMFFHLTFFKVCGGYSTTVEYISLLKAYADETDPVVWTDILLNINKLEKLFQLTNVYDQFKAFVISLLLPLSERIGPESRDEDSKLFYDKKINAKGTII